MNGALLNRLRAMTLDEAIWRSRQFARTTAQRAVSCVRQPRWERRHLRTALADGVIDYMFRSDSASWVDMHAELRAHLRERRSRFALDPASRDALRERVATTWAGAPAEAAARADRVLLRHYDLLGYSDIGFDQNGRVAWHHDPVHQRTAPRRFWANVPYLDPSSGDHKVIWELNRHQHWLRLGRAYWLTGDARYGDAIVAELEDWLAANPPLTGINWASMLELGFRSMSWIWGLHFLLADKPQVANPNSDNPWLVDMFVGLHHQLTHIERNLSLYFSPNTHLTGEALALYVAGVALPELAGSPRWADTGRRILLTEIGRQIGRDGGHAERSTHYQRYTLDFYLMALLTAQRDSDHEAAAAFSRASMRLAEYTRTMADAGGCLPLIGDDDGGRLWQFGGRACNDVRDSLALAATVLNRPDLAPWGVQEEAVWIAGPAAIERSGPLAPQPDAIHLRSHTFADTGYVVVRDQFHTHAVIDVGPHGYLNGGHAHADALALTLKLNGRQLLIDPGTGTYTMNARLRDQLRSSMSHNTLSFGGQSIAASAGPFHWRTRADAALHGSRHNEAFDWVEASHDACAPTRHRRTVFRSPLAGWIVVDEVLGEGTITASAHWHFDPAWSVDCETVKAFRARHHDGTTVWLLHEGDGVLLARGDPDSGLGWFAPVYGSLVPTWTARAIRSTAAPFTMATWIGMAQGERAPSLDRVRVHAPECPQAVGVRMATASGIATFFFRPGLGTSRPGDDCAVDDYQTDGRVFHYYVEHKELAAFALVDGTHALALRDGWLSVAATEPLRDLSGTLRGTALELHANTPGPELRLHGGALHRVSHIRLNGRDMSLPEARPLDTIVIAGADWGAPVRLLLPHEATERRMDVFSV